MPSVAEFIQDYPDLAEGYQPDQLQRYLKDAGLWLRSHPWTTTQVGADALDHATYLIMAHGLEYKRLQMATSAGVANNVGSGSSGSVASVGEWWSLSVYGSAWKALKEMVEQQAREEMSANVDEEYPLDLGRGFALSSGLADDPIVIGINYG